MTITPLTRETIAEILAREFAVFERQEAEMKASERRERASALGLPLSPAAKAAARHRTHSAHPSRSPPSTGA